MSLVFYYSLLIIELFLSFFFVIYALTLLYASYKGAPFVPTANKIIDQILKTARLKKNQNFYELGSGDGRILIKAVRDYKVIGTGIEVNRSLILLSRFLSRKQENIRFLCQNILTVNLQPADVIYMFLMPPLIKTLVPKFQRELKPGTLIISHGFKIEPWSNKLIQTITNKPFSTYFYKV